ncbi:MAG: DUF1801 domain-containing protein [Microthrixaceae bacterium]
MAAAPDGTARVEEYLATLDPDARATLERLRATLRTVLPRAEEGMKYGMPAVVLGDKGVAGYAAFSDHCGYFPMSGDVLGRAGELVAGYTVSKGGLQFPIGTRLPVGLVRRLVRLRLDELAEVVDGRVVTYYDDGAVKSTGRMRAGEMAGAWEFFRKDGTLLRSGRFHDATPVGTWRTYRRDGSVATTTER